ncbi:Phenylalanine-tRNA ligase [Mycoplasma leachii 06049]|uniref:Phenylalanine-tRNA ligase n=1 Tax=Mycoplasma leachii 06049 TaxID=1188244 RepID=A0A2T4IAN3_9MOLU|nr:Phenylalanine-tRNA ligase [Mycoplasma leachii 06049]
MVTRRILTVNNIKFGIFYSKQFNSLLVSFYNKKVTSIQQINNITILKNNDQIIGANIFNVDQNLDLKSIFCSEDPKVVNYVIQTLKDIILINQEQQFLIGRIIDCEPIEGTHLNICKVDIKDEILQIICGASNVRKKMISVVATLNSWLPNGTQIIQSKIRGVDSFGMLCSYKELNIENEQQGIIDLGSEYNNKIGESFWKEYYAK